MPAKARTRCVEDVQATIDFINENILNDAEGLRPGKVQALRDAVQAAQALQWMTLKQTADAAEGSEQSDDQGSTGAVGDRVEGRAGSALIEVRKRLP